MNETLGVFQIRKFVEILPIAIGIVDGFSITTFAVVLIQTVIL